jgi:hypothetical protein
VGRESLRTLRYLVKKRALDRKYHLLIYLIGAVIGFIVVYSPYITNPVILFTQIILNQSIRTTAGAPRVIGGVSYENAPWWSYFFWTYADLGLLFVFGLLIAIFYTLMRYIKKEGIEEEQNLMILYILIPFVLMSLLKVKSANYHVMFYPLYSTFIVVNISMIVNRALKSSKNEVIRNNIRIFPVLAMVGLMLLPGPLWMTIDDPHIGRDSGYDTVGDMVVEYINDHPFENVTVLAFDTLSVEFYIPDEDLKEVEILPLFSDNYSTDIIGRPYVFISDEKLLNMTQNNEIHILVDEPNRNVERKSETRIYIANHYIKIAITDALVVYRIIT